MGKKLITVGNYQQYVTNSKLYMQSDYIITAGAKDTLRQAGIELVYGTPKSKEEKCTQCYSEIDKVLVEMLVKEFKITDPDKIELVVQKVKKML